VYGHWHLHLYMHFLDVDGCLFLQRRRGYAYRARRWRDGGRSVTPNRRFPFHPYDTLQKCADGSVCGRCSLC
jgi:hypothetical protein